MVLAGRSGSRGAAVRTVWPRGANNAERSGAHEASCAEQMMLPKSERPSSRTARTWCSSKRCASGERLAELVASAGAQSAWCWPKGAHAGRSHALLLRGAVSVLQGRSA